MSRLEGFEVFSRRNLAKGPPALRIAAGGNLMNINAAASVLLEGTTHVVLLYDRAQDRIGLRPCGGDDLGAYVVHRMQTTRASSVAAGAFTRVFGIPAGARYLLSRHDGLLIGERDHDENAAAS